MGGVCGWGGISKLLYRTSVVHLNKTHKRIHRLFRLTHGQTDREKGLTNRPTDEGEEEEEEEEERDSSFITCHPSRNHVHLGGVWLQDAIQLLLGCRVGCKVDRPEKDQRNKEEELKKKKSQGCVTAKERDFFHHS